MTKSNTWPDASTYQTLTLTMARNAAPKVARVPAAFATRATIEVYDSDGFISDDHSSDFECVPRPLSPMAFKCNIY